MISDLKKFVSPQCIEALEKAVGDAKSQMMSDWEQKTDDNEGGTGDDHKDRKMKDKKGKKPSLSDLKNVAANFVKSLLSVIEKNGGIKDVIYDSEGRRVAWSYLQATCIYLYKFNTLIWTACMDTSNSRRLRVVEC